MKATFHGTDPFSVIQKGGAESQGIIFKGRSGPAVTLDLSLKSRSDGAHLL